MGSSTACDLIAFAPHPDDAELFCGGTLLRLSSMGYRIGVIDLTGGERGTRGAPEVRERELEKASAVLGLSVRESLGLPDMGLSEADAAQREAVAASIRRHKPRVVLAPHWGDRHPDHVQASALVTSAVFLAGAARFAAGDAFKTRALAYYQGSLEFEPSFIVDISDQFDLKMEAILCYESQFSLRVDGEPDTDIADPRFLDRVRARARHYGLTVGVKYGEPFFSRTPPVVADPIHVLADDGI